MQEDRGGENVGTEGRISIKEELFDEVLKEYRGPQDFEEIFKQFKKSCNGASAGGGAKLKSSRRKSS